MTSISTNPTPTRSKSFNDSFRLIFRVLTFRATREELIAVNNYDLIVGLLFTWLVGMGRYWDNPRVELLQQMGVGSVIYVFILAWLLYWLIKPMEPKDWRYFRLLTFVTLTSPPGLIYALPVQMIFPEPGLETANEINLGFLFLVSVWRVSLLFWYCSRVGDLHWWRTVIGSTAPIVFIICGLTILNLERVVFDAMSGISETSPNDDIYMVLSMITSLSLLLALPLAVIYVITMATIENEDENLETEVTAETINSDLTQ